MSHPADTEYDIPCDNLPEGLADKPFRHYFRTHWRTFVPGVVSVFLTDIFDTLTPLVLMLAIDHIRLKDRLGLNRAILIYVALMLGVTLFRYLWRIYFGRFHQAVAEDLRNRIFARLTVLGPSFYQKKPVGQLMSLLTNDVNTFRMSIGMGTLILIDAIFMLAMIIPLMIYLSFDWTWKTLLLAPLLPFFIGRIEKLIHERSRREQDLLSEVSASTQEIISGIRVIKSYVQEENKRDQFNSVSRSFERSCNAVARVDAYFEPVMEFAVASGGVALLYLCSSDVVRGSMTLGTFVAFHEYIRRMAWPMSAIGVGISMYQQGRASFDRIRDLLKTETDIPDSGSVVLRDFEKLEVRELSFRYPGSSRNTLENISFQIRAGETVGVVGPVGSGKTTLMQLLCRLYPAEPERIRINGHCVNDIRISSLRGIISLVPQDAFLFSDTIGGNIALGLPEAPSTEAVHEITRMVNLDQEIAMIPAGLDAYLGERGVNLSGGQKQRLTIARALIRRSPVVILDDSLSAVDGKTEKTIVRSLREVLSSRENRRQTTFIVSHRLATLKHASHIIVLNEGRIEAVGTHEELLVSSTTYRSLHKLQDDKKVVTTAGAEAVL